MSKNDLIFRVSAEGGRMVSSALRHFAATAKRGVYWFRVSEVRPTRTLAQNSYLWGVVYKIPADHFGMTVDEFHEAMKLMFLLVREDGKPPYLRSTASLSVAEMTEYIEKIREWAMREYRIDIPDAKRWYEDDIISDE